MAKTPTLTPEQFAALAEYEQNFRTAVNQRYTRNPGRNGLAKMESIWRDLSYPGFKLNYNCSTCVFNIVNDLGRIWLKMKEEQDAITEKSSAKTEEKPKKVATTKKKAAPVKAKKVETKK